MDQAPSEALAPEDFAAAVNRLVLTRWLAAVLVAGLTLLCVRGFAIPLPVAPLLLLAVALAGENALLAVLDLLLERATSLPRERRLGWYRRMVVAQVGLDWIAITAFVHYTGGVTSPAIVLFLIHMLLVTALLQRPSPYIYPVLATLSLCAVAALESTGVIPHHDVLPWPADFHRELRFVAAPIAFFAIASFASVHMTNLAVVRLRERDRQISALLLASQAASSSLEIDEVLDHLVGSAQGALAGHGAVVRLLAETGEHVNMSAARGLSAHYLDHGIPDIAASPLDRAALAGAAVVVDDVRTDARVPRPAEAIAAGITSMLIVPVLGRRGPLGTLHVYARAPHAFTPDRVAFARSIAAQGAAAIENALIHEQLQRAERSRGQFVRTVTHELRSPVAGTLSLAQALQDGLVGELAPEPKRMLARMSARLGALGELINDLLALAASQSPELQEPPKKVDLLSALRRVEELQAADAESKNVTLHCELPADPVIVTATDQGLTRLFGNLLGNAVKYTPPGGRVELHAVVESGSAVVTVTDTGMGIPEKDLPRLFEDFFRASNTRSSDITGTGLGLAIVKRLVASYRGVIDVRSEVGRGTTFTVALPLAEVAPAAAR